LVKSNFTLRTRLPKRGANVPLDLQLQKRLCQLRKNCSSVALRRSIWRLLPHVAGCGLSDSSQLRKGAWLPRSFTLSTTTLSFPGFLIRFFEARIETRSFPTLARSYPRRFSFYLGNPFETRSRPRSLAASRRGFTFYLGNPVSSIPRFRDQINQSEQKGD
jgi:hypothetical protein